MIWRSIWLPDLNLDESIQYLSTIASAHCDVARLCNILLFSSRCISSLCMVYELSSALLQHSGVALLFHEPSQASFLQRPDGLNLSTRYVISQHEFSTFGLQGYMGSNEATQSTAQVDSSLCNVFIADFSAVPLYHSSEQ
eukprot:Gb_29867 [translate_table: standard]